MKGEVQEDFLDGVGHALPTGFFMPILLSSISRHSHLTVLTFFSVTQTQVWISLLGIVSGRRLAGRELAPSPAPTPRAIPTTVHCPGTTPEKPGLPCRYPAPNTPIVITEARGTALEGSSPLCHPAGYRPPLAFTGPSICSEFTIILLTNCLWMQVMNGRVITTALRTPSSR